jgi:glycosyltransferase involved in cell wall biosynthesis
MTSDYEFSFVIPVYNEGRYLQHFLEKLTEMDLGKIYEIIIIDDGSLDDTRTIASTYANNSVSTGFSLNYKNRGYGYSIIKGINIAKSNKIFLINPDFPINHSSILEMILRSVEYDLVIGRRILNKHRISVSGSLYNTFSNNINSISHFAFNNIKISDPGSPIRLFNKKKLLEGPIRWMTRDISSINRSITRHFLKKKYKVIEIPLVSDDMGEVVIF